MASYRLWPMTVVNRLIRGLVLLLAAECPAWFTGAAILYAVERRRLSAGGSLAWYAPLQPAIIEAAAEAIK
jgi:hypothetical protein